MENIQATIAAVKVLEAARRAVIDEVGTGPVSQVLFSAMTRLERDARAMLTGGK